MPDTGLIAVIGAGTMGSGIAQVAAQAGYEVLLYDIQQEFVERGLNSIAAGLLGRVDRGKMTEAEMDAIMGRISATTNRATLAPATVVIEAAIEDLAVKQEIFAALDALCGPETILASNTSSLSITALAGAVSRPERVVGMHFFNPAPVMALVEVVAGRRSAPEAVAATVELARRMGKTPVPVADTPGFIVNRVARPFYGEALRLLGEQVAPVDTIDRLVKLAGFRMGPFELMDLIGIDVNFAVTQSVYAAFFGDPRYRPHPIQQRMVEAGLIGRKRGAGFYLYDGDPPRPHPAAAPDPAYATALTYQRLPSDLDQQLCEWLEMSGVDAAIHDEPLAGFVLGRILCQIINEAAFALGEGVASAADIDTAMRMGTNYPLGPLAWGNKLGLALVLDVLQYLQHFYGEERYRPAPLLRQLVAVGRRGRGEEGF
jgi:3-hydroxybutyryl-CoA dehydrogenase